MRGENDILQPLQWRNKRVLVGSRLNRKHVNCRTGEMAFFQNLGQRFQIDHRTARIVDEEGALLHLAQLGFGDHLGRRLVRWHMQTDHVGNFEQFVERFSRNDITVLQLVGHVEIADRHAEAFSQIADLRTDIAIADDTQRFATHFATACRALVPAARMGRIGARENAAHQHDDFTNHQLSHRARIGEWCIENGNAALASSLQIHLICANRVATDSNQALRCFKHFVSELCA
ncbi:hypothetical protein D3C80_545530 [compost metagenome]